MSSSDSGDSLDAAAGAAPAAPGAAQGAGTAQPGPHVGTGQVFAPRSSPEAAAAERVELDAYSGPLDLLLYLIKENEVDIFDIPIAPILAQFLDHVELMRDLDIDRAGEFLLMASTLMEIKSRMLIPADQVEEVEAEDPRSELVRQLLEYRRFKQAASRLAALAAKRALLYGRLLRETFAGDSPAADEGEILENVTLYHLAAAYEKMMRETMGTGPAQLVYDDVSVEERIEEVLVKLREKPVRGFRELLTPASGAPGIEGRLDIVGTFLACLELTRRKLVRILQAGERSEIIVQVRAGDESDDLRPLSLDELAGRVGRPIDIEGREEEALVEEEAPAAGVLTREVVAVALRKLGLREGDLVVVHSSFKSLGPVEGGPRAVALAVCDAVGETGTVVMPTYTRWKPGLAPAAVREDIWTGAIPRAFSELPGSVRDNHFRESFAYRGARAEELVRANERRAYPAGSERMIARLAAMGGKVLLLGVGYGSACASAVGEELSRSEHAAGRRENTSLTQEEFLGLAPEEQAKVHERAAGGRERDYGKIEPTVASMGIQTLGEIGEAEVRLAPAGKLIETAAGALDANPDLLLMTEKEIVERRRSGDAAAQRRVHFKGTKRTSDLEEMDKEEEALRRRVDKALRRADEISERIEAMRKGGYSAVSPPGSGQAPGAAGPDGQAPSPPPPGHLTREEAAGALRGLGLREGDLVVAYSSFKSLGPVHGGPLAVISALLDVVGDRGTAVMPAFTEYEPGGPADPTLMDTWTGILGLTLSRMAGAVRSRHPMRSHAACGPMARELALADNARAFAWGEESLLYRTAAAGGKVLLIGVGHEADATVRLAEELAECPYLRARRARSGLTLDEFLAMGDDEKTKLLAECLREPKRAYEVMDGLLEPRGLQRRDKLGSAWVRVALQADVLKAALELLHREPAGLLAPEEREKPGEWPVGQPPEEAFGKVPVIELPADDASDNEPGEE